MKNCRLEREKTYCVCRLESEKTYCVCRLESEKTYCVCRKFRVPWACTRCVVLFHLTPGSPPACNNDMRHKISDCAMLKF